MATPNTIHLKGEGIVKEGNAGGTITPGHLVKRTSTANQVVVHATADGNAVPMFALEADFIGKGIDTNYASTDRVQFLVADRGCEVYALLPASAAAVVVGDFLVSNGDGTLKKYTAQATNEGGAGTYTIQTAGIVGVALEAVDNSVGGTPVRIRVEVL